MRDAKLFVVQTPRGQVFAVFDVTGSAFWTERTEEAAHQLAKEKGLTFSQQQSLPLAEFLRLTGRESTAGAQTTGESQAHRPLSIDDLPLQADGTANSRFTEGVAPAPPSPAPSPAFTFRARYHFDGEPAAAENEPILVQQSPAPIPKGVFCSEGQVSDAEP
jgi:hypothetical protein